MGTWTFLSDETSYLRRLQTTNLTSFVFCYVSVGHGQTWEFRSLLIRNRLVPSRRRAPNPVPFPDLRTCRASGEESFESGTRLPDPGNSGAKALKAWVRNAVHKSTQQQTRDHNRTGALSSSAIVVYHKVDAFVLGPLETLEEWSQTEQGMNKPLWLSNLD